MGGTGVAPCVSSRTPSSTACYSAPILIRAPFKFLSTFFLRRGGGEVSSCCIGGISHSSLLAILQPYRIAAFSGSFASLFRAVSCHCGGFDKFLP